MNDEIKDPLIDTKTNGKNEKKDIRARLMIVSATIAIIAITAIAILFFAVGEKQKSEVPDLIGKSLGDAFMLIDESGFQIEIRGGIRGSDTFVVSQSPFAGEMLAKDGIIYVSLEVMSEDFFERMPDLEGMNLDEAESLLRNNEIEPLIKPLGIDRTRNWTVVSQDPLPGSALKADAVVTLFCEEAERPSNREGASEEDQSMRNSFVGEEGHLIVCLDPGHSATPSEIDPETGLNTQDWINEPEIEIVFDIATKAKVLLEQKGIRVVMTKSSVYEPVNLKQRAVIGNESGAQMICHIHSDSGIVGVATFYPSPYPNNWKANSVTGRKAYLDEGVQRSSMNKAKLFHEAMYSHAASLMPGLTDSGLIPENRGTTGTGNYGPIFTYDIWSEIPTFTIEMNQAKASSNREAFARAIAEGIAAAL